jgi:hypothetical protein
VIGWLAMVWASFALAPLKRFIIEFPFVAAKAIPSQPSRAAVGLMPCIRNIVYRRVAVSAIRAMYAVIACFSWCFPLVFDQ